MTLALEVSGMTCDGCKQAVERVVRKVPGVRSAQVTLATGRLDVEGEPERALVEAAIRKAGYGVTSSDTV